MLFVGRKNPSVPGRETLHLSKKNSPHCYHPAAAMLCGRMGCHVPLSPTWKHNFRFLELMGIGLWLRIGLQGDLGELESSVCSSYSGIKQVVQSKALKQLPY